MHGRSAEPMADVQRKCHFSGLLVCPTHCCLHDAMRWICYRPAPTLRLLCAVSARHRPACSCRTPQGPVATLTVRCVCVRACVRFTKPISTFSKRSGVGAFLFVSPCLLSLVLYLGPIGNQVDFEYLNSDSEAKGKWYWSWYKI